MSVLEIKNLSVKVAEKVILDNISFTVGAGQVYVIMGPNGSGKSTLANVIMGHPLYKVESGSIIYDGHDITNYRPEERAALGIFMSFQQPREVAGVDYYPFLFEAYKSLCLARKIEPDDVFTFKKNLDEQLTNLQIDGDWGQRCLNSGFSGGEKKKSEMLQLALLKPELAIFDEIDSGLDVDALEVVGRAIREFIQLGKSALVVTHYQRILKYISADKVLVLSQGKIVAAGGAELARQLEDQGFSKILGKDFSH